MYAAIAASDTTAGGQPAPADRLTTRSVNASAIPVTLYTWVCSPTPDPESPIYTTSPLPTDRTINASNQKINYMTALCFAGWRGQSHVTAYSVSGKDPATRSCDQVRA